ncbi:MAG: radical SAM protein [Clostridiaceae bacterium]|nr:radical SAM protein [Clostridiaceae bacterium]
MSKWKKSIYTFVIEKGEEIILYNSFMGAIARIPKEHTNRVRNILNNGIDEIQLDELLVAELCVQGFLIDSEINEQYLVRSTLEKEQDSTLGLTIMPHEDCNFRCSYCYESFENGLITPKIMRGIKLFVKKKAERENFLRMTCSWFGGEPLLAFDEILDMSDAFIESCNENDIKYLSSMTTNGYLLTPERVEKLIERNVLYFQITLDGPEEIHNRSRKLVGGQGTYSTIMKNLIALKDINNKDLTVKIRVNFSPTTIETIENWIRDEIAPEFSADKRFMITFQPIRNWGRCNKNINEYFHDQIFIGDYISYLNNACINLGFSKQDVRQSLDPHGNVCYASKSNSIVIGSDGSIYKCTVAFDNSINSIGVINVDGTLNLNKVKMGMWTKDYVDSTEKCGKCAFYPSCQTKKCPLISINCGNPTCPDIFENIESYITATISAEI